MIVWYCSNCKVCWRKIKTNTRNDKIKKLVAEYIADWKVIVESALADRPYASLNEGPYTLELKNLQLEGYDEREFKLKDIEKKFKLENKK